MNLRKILLSVLLTLLLCKEQTVFAATDSSRIQISLLTASPGAELYSIFGHSALRIVDSTIGTDIVYNYGTFNFDDPDFYAKFVNGKLMYFLSQESFANFMYEYKYFGRGVTEQVLNLDAKEKSSLQNFLMNNISESNRYYKYDFLHDNCTSRLRDIIYRKGQTDQINYPGILIGKSTYRDYLHIYLDKAGMPWTALGIDLLLGLEADHLMTASESMFLPDFLQSGLNATHIGKRNLVVSETSILKNSQPMPTKPNFWETPMFVFVLIMLFYFSFTTKWMLKKKRLLQISDNLLFFVAGLLGLVLAYMWFGTDHQSFRNNPDLIWAMPFNAAIPFLLSRKIRWTKIYLRAYSILLLVLLFGVFLVPGSINSALIPLILALSFRSWMNGTETKD